MKCSRFMAGTLLAGLLAVLTLPTTAFAQGGGFDPAQMRQRALTDVDETIKALALEGDTADAVKTILLAQVEKRFEMMAQMRGGQGAGQGGQRGGGQGVGQGGQRGGGMREAMAQLNQETETRLAEVLSAEQLEKYRKIQAERRPAGGRRPPGN